MPIVDEFQEMIRKLVREVTVVVEVVDCRFPYLTRSSFLEDLAEKSKKPMLLCINKCDLVPHYLPMRWKNYLSKKYPTVFISTQKRWGTKHFRRNLLSLVSKSDKDVRVCIAGIPNTGKSSLINVLKGRHAAPTSPQPGWTQSIQWVRIGRRIMLLDSPGIAPVDKVPQHVLALIGAIPVGSIFI